MIKHYFFESRFIEIKRGDDWVAVELTGFYDLSSRLHDRMNEIKIDGRYEEVHHKHFISLYEKGKLR